ncbi:MAG: LacI family DNA-binding transcriptional regulator [Kineosporiaceae bacterium]|nr:LacI family DNA-binding transcriptional regulator [Kineosporiaceae bacterium]
MSRPGRPTLADVASRAGVSLKTASRAVNGEYGVAPATAQRVREAARSLGFRPNALARSLAAGGPSAAVGLVIPSVSDPFIAAVVGAVEAVLAPRDLQLITASHHDDPDRQRRIVRTLVERRVDALIVIPAPGQADYLQPEIDHGLVVVAADRPIEGVEVDTVVVDNPAGSAEVVRRLIRRGHRRIAVLGNDERLWTLQQRLSGYHAGLAAEGVDPTPELIEVNCADSALAEVTMLRLLGLDNPPTAVFAIQHTAGRGALRALRAAGIELDLAVFDEMVDTDLLITRPVAIVASGPDRLGSLCASMAIERLDGLDVPARSVMLPPLFLDQGQTYRPQPSEPRPAPAGTVAGVRVSS